MRRWIDEEIVLVASAIRRPHAGYRTLMSSFDIPKALSNQFLLHSLKQLCQKVFFYSTAESFIENIRSHQDHLVFPYYYSVGSRANNSQIQAICESSGIRYVGPEAYALTICNDKVLSKDICRSRKLDTPKCAVMYYEDDAPAVDVLVPPLIVKPVFEANSIGVTQDSVCASYEDAVAKARALYAKLKAPVLIEEFVGGTEVNICILQNGDSAPLINTVKLNKQGSVYDYRQKHLRLPFGTYEPFDGPEIEKKLNDLLAIFRMLGKVEFLRIDCIVSEGQLSCIELSPDADLSINSALYRSVSDRMNYADFLRLLIENSVRHYKNR